MYWEIGIANLFRAFWTERNGELQLLTNSSLVKGERRGKGEISQGWLVFPLENTKDKEVNERLSVSMTEVVYNPVPSAWQNSVILHGAGKDAHPHGRADLEGTPSLSLCPLQIANFCWIKLKGTAKLVAKVSPQTF